MRIALDAQLIATQPGYRSAGVSTYSLQLLRALGTLRREGATAHGFTAYVNDAALRIDGVELARTALPLDRPLPRILWEQTLLPWEARGAALLHGLVNVLPLAARVPGVVTVHDLAFLRAPESMPRVRRAYLARLCRASVAKAQRVIAVSAQTADDLHAFFGTPAGKIVVVPNGVDAAFAPGDVARAAEFRSSRSLPDRFLLFVGTLEPRKNLDGLVRAYARWCANAPDGVADVKLVIAGGKGWFYESIFAWVRSLGLEADVLFPGFVPAAELPDWYRAALAFVYPSHLEGFGLPVLEAMACGCPAVISTAPSLLEVAGDAALAVPPADEDALEHALHLVIEQESLRAELARRGLARAARFSWRRTALETLAVYEDLLRAG